MKVFTHAKINLYLHILGKRPDGFHELETLMCPLALADEMEFSFCNIQGINLTVEGAELSNGPDNLVYRAAEAVLKRTKAEKGVMIKLYKKIPMGGGLAGGSSNAAATIRSLNQLLGNPLSFEEMNEIAASMGSDINFFLQPYPAVCSGRGEKVVPLKLKNLPWVVLLNPGFGVSTPWAYKTYAQNPAKGETGCTFEWGSKVTLQNDLESAVFTKYLWISETKAWLKKQPETLDALMSGSGATVLALVSDEETGNELAQRAKEYLGEQTWVQVTRLLEYAA